MMTDMTTPIYLDYNATTPIAPEVLEAMTTALREHWGNPSSDHVYGHAARAAIETAREQVARLLGCHADEVIFTGGGTESDNAAVIGVAEACAERGKHIVISAVEHAAVDAPCRYLEGRGYAVTRVPVNAAGYVEPQAVIDALRPDTILVSVIHAQNETGVLQPIADFASVARERGIVVHSDTAQSVGKVAVSLDALQADLLTIAGHKLYAPKGVGALIVRGGTPFHGLLRGAAHESGRRSGTENTAGIVALGAACALALDEAEARSDHMRTMRDRLETGLRAGFADLVVHGAAAKRLPNTLSAAIPGVQAHQLLSGINELATAAGQACHAGEPTVSSTLLAMGVTRDVALSTMRLCVGRSTSAQDVDRAVALLTEAAGALRSS